MQHLSEIPIYSRCLDNSRQFIFNSISGDYYGRPLTKDIYVRLSIDESHLYFSSRSELFSVPSENEQGFKEGLWESEVSELFIFDSLNNKYQEFNVSPSGHFWGMNFNSYRERDGLIEGLNYVSEEKTFTLIIPLSSINVNLKSDQCLIHISGVVNQGQILYSSNPLKDTKADFHRIESALRVRLL